MSGRFAVARKQVELKFQNYIIDSYAAQGGYAQKWASEWQKGKPDLICAHPKFNMHLLEVKHEPDFGPGAKEDILNSLGEKQRSEAKRYREAGGTVWAAVVGGGPNVTATHLGLFRTDMPRWFVTDTWWASYQPGVGYDIEELIRRKINAG